jgi:hypothetical protein
VRRGNSITSWSKPRSSTGKLDYGHVEDVFIDDTNPPRGRLSLQSTTISSENTSLGSATRLQEMQIPERLAPFEFQSTISLQLQRKMASHTRHQSGSSLPSTFPRTRQNHKLSASFSSSLLPKSWENVLEDESTGLRLFQKDGSGADEFTSIQRQSSEIGDKQRYESVESFRKYPIRRRAKTNSTTDSGALWTSDISSFRARELVVASRKSIGPSHMVSTPRQSRFYEQLNDENGNDPTPKEASTLKPQVIFRLGHSYDGSDNWETPSRESPHNEGLYYGTDLVDHMPELWEKAIRSHRASLEAQVSLEIPKASIYRSLSEGSRLFGSTGRKKVQPVEQIVRSNSKVSPKQRLSTPSRSNRVTNDQKDLSSSSTPSRTSVKTQNAHFRPKQRLSLGRRALQPSSTPNIKGSWSRFPSHTKHIRSASAGEDDNVTVRDFANRESLGGRRLPKDGKNYQRMTFRGRVRQGWHRLIRSRSTEFRVSGHGPRSSIAAGGPSEFPELQILAPVFPHTLKLMRKGSPYESNRVFPHQQTSSSDSVDSNIGAGKWSELYHDCVELPDEGSSVHLGDQWSEQSLLSRPKLMYFVDVSESSSRLHQSAIDLKKTLDMNEAREKEKAIEAVKKARRGSS